MTTRLDLFDPTGPRLGLVAIATYAVLALGTAATATGAEVVGPEPKGDPAWTKLLPGGGVVELVGVSEHPPRPDSWWRPEGTPLGEAPSDKIGGSRIPGPGQQAREFVVRWTVPAGAEVPSIAWEVVPPSGHSTGGSIETGERRVPGLHPIQAILPAAGTTCTVRFGVASGPWATRAGHDGRGISANNTPTGTIILGEAREAGGKATIAVAENVEGLDLRTVAIDHS